ncbi:DUF2927 domain-containing protein [Hymenobacter armeniacus]|uniref:DUF2927 domain-containing protein n=1 Tax=Hymenobacter armeniacus TaxID=2771358 RepID=A0ABR8JPV1_9BACT|nr:DUF2927 domain-containing protein [Hymenobacter armeniacus]MBD2722016.1 DUF2927 domain-containing protein [Hymenobacter armeniacus]
MLVIGFYARQTWSCHASLTPAQAKRLRTEYSREDLSYFGQIAFGNDLGTLSETIHRWNRPVVRVAIMTACTAAEKQEVRRVLADLNTISRSTKFQLQPDKPDLRIYFAPIQDIPQLFRGHDGSANGTFAFRTTPCGEITSATVAVANNLTFEGHEEAIIREEIAQSIGLPKDTNRYPKSVFSSNRQIVIDQASGDTYRLFATEFLPIDRRIISILYNSGIPVNTSRADFTRHVLAAPE